MIKGECYTVFTQKAFAFFVRMYLNSFNNFCVHFGAQKLSVSIMRHTVRKTLLSATESVILSNYETT